MTGAEGLGSAASAYFLQPLQTNAKVSGGLSGGEGAGGMSGGEGAGSVSTSISSAGQLVSNLQQLQAQNPTEFQQVVSQIATQFQTAAQEQGQSSTGNFLTQLATQFQNVANGGDISQLQSDNHAQTYNSSGQSVPSTASSASATSSGTSVQQLFANIANQVAQALGT